MFSVSFSSDFIRECGGQDEAVAKNDNHLDFCSEVRENFFPVQAVEFDGTEEGQRKFLSSPRPSSIFV